MSVYRQKDPKTGKARGAFLYDFKVQVLGRKPAARFFGSTGQKTRRKAEEYESRLKELAANGMLSSDMTVEQACWKYWEQEARHCRSADDQAKNLEIVSRYIGPEVLLVTITPEMIAEAAERRLRTPIERRQRVGKELIMAPTKLYPKPATVNRQLIEPLRRLLIRAKKVWRVPIDLEQFDWGMLSRKESAPRVREMSIEEERAFWQALRPDYASICEMYLLSGRRRSDWVGFSKFKLDRTQGTARFPTRKRKEVGEIVVELTQRELEIICQECDKAPESEFVFTYEIKRGKQKGKRAPITADGLRQAVAQAFKLANIQDFRKHDWRHTFASRALRGKGGDIRTLMAAMDHQDISSTVRYTHMASGQAREMREGVTTHRQLPDNVTPLRSKSPRAPS
jgi:integrase